MDLGAIDRINHEDLRKRVREFIAAAIHPAFGALPQRELNLLIFDLMRDTGVLSTSASTYDLMTALKITRTRARALLFDIEIRDSARAADLDAKAKAALAHPQGYVTDGAYVTFAVENPLVQAHIQHRVRNAGHLTDTSFDTSLVRLKPAALGALIAGLLTDEEKEIYDEAMRDAGLKVDRNLATMITAGLKFVSKKYLGETATEMAEGYLADFAGFLEPVVAGAKDRIRATFGEMAETDAAQAMVRPRAK